MMNTETIQASGLLEIVKIYSNGSEEVIFSDHNLITSGFGVNLGLMFAGSGSTNIRHHQIRWFGIGSGSYTGTNLNTSISILSGAVSMPEGTPSITRTIVGAGGPSNPIGTASLSPIPNSSIKRTGKMSVTYYLLIPNKEGSGDSVDITEVGLFVDKPYNAFSSDATILVAYRTFPLIKKTNDFSLLFKWTISV